MMEAFIACRTRRITLANISYWLCYVPMLALGVGLIVAAVALLLAIWNGSLAGLGLPHVSLSMTEAQGDIALAGFSFVAAPLALSYVVGEVLRLFIPK